MPIWLSLAPTIPATAVPWKTGSVRLVPGTAAVPVPQSAPPLTLRSGWSPRDPRVDDRHVDVHRPPPVSGPGRGAVHVDAVGPVRQTLHSPRVHHTAIRPSRSGRQRDRA